MSDIYFHIGLHKTGTTFLQRNVFPYIKGINFYTQHQKSFKIGQNYHGKTLVSKESLSGSPFKSNDINIRAQRMYQLRMYYPNANIIVMIRENGWKESLYSTYIKDGGILSYKEWESQIFNPDYANYHHYIKALKHNFNRVLVLSYEDFKVDNNYTIKKICNFMGVDFPYNYKRKKIGVSLTERKIKIYRLLNNLPIKRKDLIHILDKYIKRGK